MYLTGEVKNKTMEQQSISFLSFLFKAMSFFLDLGRIFLDSFLSLLVLYLVYKNLCCPLSISSNSKVAIQLTELHTTSFVLVLNLFYSFWKYLDCKFLFLINLDLEYLIHTMKWIIVNSSFYSCPLDSFS